MSPATQKLPSYLRKFIAKQNYDAYTARDHAAWRYIMRQNCRFFSHHAVPVYLEGLKKTGISLDRIPRVTEMDECLAKFGWGAVPVEGFIPPAAFLDFQARGVLPIASDMRTVDHIAYTPAPDIVHEAAGHAPIISHAPYARYLNRYAAMAQRAIFSLDDIRLYEAIRYLSDIKENPDATPAEIQRAEARLKEVAASITEASEAAKVARMNWWTVEYGLVGDVKNPRIYGAGLLSSVGESQTCLSDKVKKIPLSVDCVNVAYDITEPQPQLFVAKDMDQLVEVLETFETSLAYRRGGAYGLSAARKSATLTTTELDSGLQISGVLADFRSDSSIDFVRYSGPVQLSFGGEELPGHGRSRHGSGFSSPLGRWRGAAPKATAEQSDADLKKAGIEKGKATQLVFASGIEVTGTVIGWTRIDGKLVLLTWDNCRVTRGAEIFFQPEWGAFDMAVGESVTAVFGGPADHAAYGEFDVGQANSKPGRSSPFTDEEKSLFALYADLRKLRETPDAQATERLAERVTQNFPGEWLLQLELYELGRAAHSQSEWLKGIEASLRRLEKSGPPRSELIRKGLEIAAN